MRYLFIFTLVLFFCGDASAQIKPNAPYHFTAQQLADWCNSDYDTEYGICAGYLTAVADIMLQQDVHGISACNHKAVKSEQLIKLYTQYLQNNVAHGARPARDVVAEALSRAFPCF